MTTSCGKPPPETELIQARQTLQQDSNKGILPCPSVILKKLGQYLLTRDEVGLLTTK
jgi:hypothetical protein